MTASKGIGKGHRFKDRIGEKHGSITVVGPCEKLNGRTKWKCLCICGKVRWILSNHLNRTDSFDVCRCAPKVTHGHSYEREWNIHRLMIDRCYNADADNFKYYGAKGTHVCHRWRESYEYFLADVGAAPSKEHTLDRIDSKGSYTCGHCDECKTKSQPANVR